MKRATIAILSLTLALGACAQPSMQSAEGPQVAGGASAEERGAYLAMIGGCHDCHTPGFMQTGWEVPESDWLTGVSVGWRGPWGTSYGKNLRLTVQSITEDQWVEMLSTRKALPPMPWPLVNRWSEADMRAIYRFIASLGPGGAAAPSPVPPGQEPTTPFVVLAPPQSPSE